MRAKWPSRVREFLTFVKKNVGRIRVSECINRWKMTKTRKIRKNGGKSDRTFFRKPVFLGKLMKIEEIRIRKVLEKHLYRELLEIVTPNTQLSPIKSWKKGAKINLFFRAKTSFLVKFRIINPLECGFRVEKWHFWGWNAKIGGIFDRGKLRKVLFLE